MELDYKIIHKVSELPNFDKTLPVFSDIETDDLYGPLRMIQFYQPETSPTIYIVDIAPTGYSKEEWKHQLLSIEDFCMSHWTIWYNSSYDLGTMNISPSLGIKHPSEVTEDTKYNSRVDDLFYLVKITYPEFMEFGLKKIVKKLRYTSGLYQGVKTDEAVKGFVRGAYISSQAYKYAALDVYALSLIWQDDKIQRMRKNVSYRVDMESQAYALIYQQNGLLLDREMWKEKLEFATKEVEKYQKLLPPGFNPNSYKQVRALLDITKSAHEDLIEHKGSDSPTAKLAGYIIDCKKYMKQKSYLKSIEFDKMFTKFNVAGAVTGRYTSAGGCLVDHFNAQQIPRELQKLFTQDMGDTSVIDLDYSTLELRLACAIYGVSHMRKQFLEGRDLHVDMALVSSTKTIAPDGYPEINHRNLLPWGHQDDKYMNEKERNDAKAINFGYVFGMSAKSYVGYAYTNYGVSVTQQESTNLRTAYFKLYPELAKKHSEVWNNYKKPSYIVETALNRRVKPKLGTDGINIPIQGSGAETTKLGAIYLIRDNPIMLRYIFNVVHDAIYSRVPTVEKPKYEDLQRAAMLKGWTEISKARAFIYKDIPIEVE